MKRYTIKRETAPTRYLVNYREALNEEQHCVVTSGNGRMKSFDLEPMTRRDARADPLSGAFDFGNPNFKKLVLPLREDCPYGTSLAHFRASWPHLRTIGKPGD